MDSLKDGDGNQTGEVVGEMLTEYSFHDNDGNAIEGAVIDPSDKSGQKFIDNEIIRENPSIVSYVLSTGRHHGDHDFKTRGENKDWRPDQKK